MLPSVSILVKNKYMVWKSFLIQQLVIKDSKELENKRIKDGTSTCSNALNLLTTNIYRLYCVKH